MLVSAELQRLGFDGALEFSELRASDVQSRARAYQSLTGAGMDDADARRIAGLDTELDRGITRGANGDPGAAAGARDPSSEGGAHRCAAALRSRCDSGRDSSPTIQSRSGAAQ